MSKPLRVDLPHSLGAAEAKSRMQNSIGKLSDHIPGGAEVQHRWEGDRMHLLVRAMGQEVSGTLDVEERKVHVELMLPAFLGLLAGKVEGALRKRGGELLEDKRKG